MVKKIFQIVVITTLLLGLMGCGSQNNISEDKEPNIKPSNNTVSLLVKDGTLTNTGATLIISNDTDKLLHYTDAFEMEIKEDKKWNKINADRNFNQPSPSLKAHSKKEIELNWEYSHGKLEKGEYRIINEVYFENESEQKFNIICEFIIK